MRLFPENVQIVVVYSGKNTVSSRFSMAKNIRPHLQAVRHILTALPYGSVAAFYQTDVRLPTEGQVSKAFLVLKAAEDVPEARGFGGVDVLFTVVLGCWSGEISQNFPA